MFTLDKIIIIEIFGHTNLKSLKVNGCVFSCSSFFLDDLIPWRPWFTLSFHTGHSSQVGEGGFCWPPDFTCIPLQLPAQALPYPQDSNQDLAMLWSFVYCLSFLLVCSLHKTRIVALFWGMRKGGNKISLGHL